MTLRFFFQWSNFFYNYTTYRKKKLHAFAAKKKIHGFTVFLYTSYIFHCSNAAPTLIQLGGTGKSSFGRLGISIFRILLDLWWCLGRVTQNPES